MAKSLGGSWLVAVCVVGGGWSADAATNPKSALLTIRCGDMQASKDSDKSTCKGLELNSAKPDGQYLDGTLEWYSGGVLVATEIGPRLLGRLDGNIASIDVLVTGNGDAAVFNAWYVDRASSLLNSPDLTVKVWSRHGHDTALVAFQPYAPVTGALWAAHSGDAADAQAAVDTESMRARTAETSLAADLAAERAARIAGDRAMPNGVAAEIARATAAENGLQAGLAAEIARATGAEANVQGGLAAEIARATGAEAMLTADLATQTQALAAEAQSRAAADANLNAAMAAETQARTAAEAAINAALAAETQARIAADASLRNDLNTEIAARTAADAALMAGLNAEVGNRVAGLAAEAMARTMNEATLTAAIMAEANSRAAGDTAAMAYTDSRTPWPLTCQAGQIAVSTGNKTWACAANAASLPDCAAGQLLVSTGNKSYVCRSICSGNVVDTQTDVANCGACAKPCSPANASPSCANAACGISSCNNGFADCDNNVGTGCEINVNTNSSNCGGCGKACANGQICNAGACSAILISDNSWKQMLNAPGGWQAPGFNDAGWAAAVDEGAVGTQPWGAVQPFANLSPPAHWIWYYDSRGGGDNSTVYFRHSFTPVGAKVTLSITADDSYVAYFDGNQVGQGNNWGATQQYVLNVQANKTYVFAISATNGGGPGGLIVDVR